LWCVPFLTLPHGFRVAFKKPTSLTCCDLIKEIWFSFKPFKHFCRHFVLTCMPFALGLTCIPSVQYSSLKDSDREAFLFDHTNELQPHFSSRSAAPNSCRDYAVVNDGRDTPELEFFKGKLYRHVVSHVTKSTLVRKVISVVLPVRMLQLENCWSDLHEMW
jgi:hypothetical protein